MGDYNCRMQAPDDDHPSPWIFLWIALFIMFIGFVWAGIAYCVEGSEKAGQFGDAFGVINALFSSLAAAGAVYAVILQRTELKEARRSAFESAKAQADLVKLQATTAIFTDRVAYRDYLSREFAKHQEEAIKRDAFHRIFAKTEAEKEFDEQGIDLHRRWDRAVREVESLREIISQHGALSPDYD